MEEDEVVAKVKLEERVVSALRGKIPLAIDEVLVTASHVRKYRHLIWEDGDMQ